VQEQLDNQLRRLWRQISLRRKFQLLGLLLLMLIASVVEAVNVGSIAPFLGAIVSPSAVFDNEYLHPLFLWIGITSPQGILIPIAIFFGALTLITGAFRVCLVWYITRLSNLIGADLCSKAYRNTLYQPYLVHISRNSSEISSGVVKVSILVGSITMLFSLFSSTVIIILIISALSYVNFSVAFFCITGFGSVYACIILVTKNKIAKASSDVAKQAMFVDKALREGLGGIRDVLIDNAQDVYCRAFESADYISRRAQGNIAIIAATPRYMLECVGILILLFMACIFHAGSMETGEMIALLGTLGFGAQRLLPLLQNAYSSYIGIKGSKASVDDVLALLEQPIPSLLEGERSNNKIDFISEVRLINVGFKYPLSHEAIFAGLNLTIKKGDRIGFIGSTGGGKSTLLDIIMGLISPTDGCVEVDGVPIDSFGICCAWQKHVAHVPQSIFLSDASLLENIAFSVPKNEIDLQKVIQAAKLAQIADLVESMPLRYDTIVGERGVKLSGGQRQRIGIARALYKNASLIVLDEATSALDNETESKVMNAIAKLNQEVTILVIAHRVTTLSCCNLILEIGNQGIIRSGTYGELIGDGKRGMSLPLQ
jgi:ABC-type multidrug transport system fused ATPase/permease subunit